MKKLFFAVAALLPAVSFAQVFNLQDNGDLQVTYKGRPLIVSERFSALPGNGFADCKSRTEKSGDHTILNRFGNLDGMKFRREAVLKNNGKEVEGTVVRVRCEVLTDNLGITEDTPDKENGEDCTENFACFHF